MTCCSPSLTLRTMHHVGADQPRWMAPWRSGCLGITISGLAPDAPAVVIPQRIVAQPAGQFLAQVASSRLPETQTRMSNDNPPVNSEKGTLWETNERRRTLSVTNCAVSATTTPPMTSVLKSRRATSNPSDAYSSLRVNRARAGRGPRVHHQCAEQPGLPATDRVQSVAERPH